MPVFTVFVLVLRVFDYSIDLVLCLNVPLNILIYCN